MMCPSHYNCALLLGRVTFVITTLAPYFTRMHVVLAISTASSAASAALVRAVPVVALMLGEEGATTPCVLTSRFHVVLAAKMR